MIETLTVLVAVAVAFLALRQARVWRTKAQEVASWETGHSTVSLDGKVVPVVMLGPGSKAEVQARLDETVRSIAS